MITLVPFVLGFIIGGFFGFLVFAVLSAARKEEEISRRQLPETGEDDG